MRNYATLTLTLSCLVIFSWLAIRPTLITIVALHKELTTLRRVNQQLTDKINALATAQDILARERTTVALLDEAAPLSADVGAVITEVEGIAGNATVALTSFQLQRVALSAKPPEISHELTENTLASSLSVKGTVERLLSFLSGLYNSRRIFTTGAIGITGSKGQGIVGDQSLQISLSAPFFHPQPKSSESKPGVSTEPTEDVLDQSGKEPRR